MVAPSLDPSPNYTAMKHRASYPHGRGRRNVAFLLGPLVVFTFLPAASAQVAVVPIAPQPVLGRGPLVPPDLVFSPNPSTPTVPQGERIRLFRIQPGFLSDPPGLDSDDKSPLDAKEPDDLDFLTLAIGNDNPWFDFRQPGDPGGVGFTRVNTQLQLFDTTRTACSLGLQAITPGGTQFDGLPDRMGPTVLTPALSVYHALDDALALQAYVGKHLLIQNGNSQPINRDFQYGMALQRPITTRNDDLFRHLYLSVGALGMYRFDAPTAARPPVLWEVLPGLHYKLADNWWISTGVSLPLGAARSDFGQHWQLTCSWQF
jgi:hypothetical protein